MEQPEPELPQALAMRQGIAEAVSDKLMELDLMDTQGRLVVPGVQWKGDHIVTTWYDFDRTSVGFAVDVEADVLYVGVMSNHYLPLPDPSNIDFLLAAVERAAREAAEHE